MNIKEVLNQHKRIAFVCSNFTDIQILLDQLKSEDIRRIYFAYQEDWEQRFHEYTQHLDAKYRSAVIIEFDRSGYNIYCRSYKNWGQYSDWHQYHFIDYSSFVREGKLNQLV